MRLEMEHKIDLSKFKFVPFRDDDLDSIFITPVFNWLARVPNWSYVRYFDTAVFKTDREVLAARWCNLDDCWNI